MDVIPACYVHFYDFKSPFQEYCDGGLWVLATDSFAALDWDRSAGLHPGVVAMRAKTGRCRRR